MNTLDQWEAEAKKHVSEFYDYRMRILTLIDLIRKKDEKFRQINECQCDECPCSWTSQEALALTEKLK